MTFGSALTQTMGQALELDRVLGYEADASGTSYLTPPDEFLGTPIASPLLTVTANRAMPSVSAVKWDDEGVESHEFPVVTEGRLVDYCTSRQTAPSLHAIYERNGVPMRSHACAVAPAAGDAVLVRVPHLTVAPATQSASIDDLCADVTRGLLVRWKYYFSIDQQFSSATLTSGIVGVLLEIEKGKVVRRVEGNGLQFSTRRFWKSLTALGDSSTMGNGFSTADKGQPWQSITQSATAPAGFFKDVDVVVTRAAV